MITPWNILYRGPLSSCNYACGYCPFAKTTNTKAELRDDAARLGQFLDWVERQSPRRIGVLFTPWGEALIHRAYQEALLRLGHMQHVARAVIQTNLSSRLEWLEPANRETIALWCTFHPGETPLNKFADKIHLLHSMGIRHSVGIVGLKEHKPYISQLRDILPPGTYLWINAYKRQPGYYDQTDLEFITGVDRFFPINNQRHPSQGLPCRAGYSSFSVDGEGTARRCHFIPQPLGNIHDPDFASRLTDGPTPCPNQTCGCHIGYVNLAHLNLTDVFGGNLLERIPATTPGAMPGP